MKALWSRMTMWAGLVVCECWLIDLQAHFEWQAHFVLRMNKKSNLVHPTLFSFGSGLPGAHQRRSKAQLSQMKLKDDEQEHVPEDAGRISSPLFAHILQLPMNVKVFHIMEVDDKSIDDGHEWKWNQHGNVDFHQCTWIFVHGQTSNQTEDQRHSPHIFPHPRLGNIKFLKFEDEDFQSIENVVHQFGGQK